MSHSTTGSAGQTPSSGVKLNRLASSTSPYLLQHASNPVDWYEWTPEAFALARERDVPIFLSVGYSACHWCHVLAHESFESEEVAKVMNEHFVNIKVDREERPDVDSFYMSFLQATSGGGGWPMSVFLTPTLQPFFAGTYFPKGRFLGLLDQISELWATKREDVVSSAEDVFKQLSDAANRKTAPGEMDVDKLTAIARSKLFEHLSSNFDAEHGGFSPRGPKFPSPAQSLDFLAAYAALPATTPSSGNPTGETVEESSRKRAAEMAVRTLQQIWKGGIRDHVGGGVARYSVDERWHVPHFEKMLYDQAQIARTSLSLALLPLDTLPPYPGVPIEEVRKLLYNLGANIFTYAEADLLDKAPSGGAFWSAEDADSKEAFSTDGERVPVGRSLEGAFYAWTAQEIDDILRDQPLIDGKLSPASALKQRYGVQDTGNVDASSDIQGELTGKNVLYEAVSIGRISKESGVQPLVLGAALKESLELLYKWRNEHRPRPHLDDKIVLGWNGLMISAYALASATLPAEYPIQSRALRIAERAATFIMNNMLDQETFQLNRTWRAGKPGPQAQTDDYAFFIRGLLDLYEASTKESWLILAIRLQERQDELFWDEKDGGYFTTAKDEHILLRQKDFQDGAEPSAVSITLSNLARLSHFDTSKHNTYTTRISQTLKNIAPFIEGAPRALATSVAALMQHQAGYRQFIVVGAPSSPTIQSYLDIIRRRFIPNRILVHIDPEALPLALAGRNEVVKDLVEDIQKRKAAGKAIQENIRLCEGFTCQLPVSSVEDVEKLVAGP